LDWYLSGCNNPDKSDNYTRLLAEHKDEIGELTNTIADFARVIGGAAYSHADILPRESLCDDEDAWVEPAETLRALRSNNRQLAQLLLFAHRVFD
jgi:hypothetical protein